MYIPALLFLSIPFSEFVNIVVILVPPWDIIGKENYAPKGFRK
jgi:hypothetical protein